MQEEEAGKKRKKKKRKHRKMRRGKLRRGKRILVGLLVTAGILIFVVVLVLRVFVMETVDVVGNEIYSDEQIEEWVLEENGSRNTMVFMLRERFRDELEIPFVESMEITFVSPSEIRVDVTEKEILGYLYIPSLGQNAYFDSDGVVVELSNDIIEGTMEIRGLEVENVARDEKLDLGAGNMLKTLISLTQLLMKSEWAPELIYIDEGAILLSYGDLQVNLGSGSLLSEKILRMEQILPQLDGESGTLHMDTWSTSNKDFYFSPGHLTAIPSEGKQTG